LNGFRRIISLRLEAAGGLWDCGNRNLQFRKKREIFWPAECLPCRNWIRQFWLMD